MTITLYGFTPTRSKRVKWTLQELGVDYENVNDQTLIGSDTLRKVHPQGKIPAITDDGRPLFESSAICNWLADSHPDKGLIAKSGTWERALHDQWCGFIMTELEAHLWTMARNSFVYPEDQRSKEAVGQARMEALKSMTTLNDHLGAHDYFVGDAFSVADIFCGFATSWAEGLQLAEEAPHVKAFNARIKARPHCALNDG
ncbi:MAG: glutathione S-transferase family protein [Hyphomicrobiaceae bacterium]